jgi:glutathione S-transferase
MKLIGVHLSPYVRKVAVALTFKGVAYEQEVVVPGMVPPGFSEISPLNKIPVLVDGDFVLPDSSVICEYLEEKFPSPPMLPAGVEARAQARFLEEYADTRLLEYASVPFIENFVNPKLRNTEPDAARVQEVTEEKLPEVLDYLESRVPQEGFLFGEFCTVDIALLSPMVNAQVGGYEPDPTRWPKYAAYLQRVKAQQAVATVLAAEKEAIAAMFSS